MIKDLLKILRQEHKTTQLNLSHILNVSQQTIASWETGRTEPNFEMLKIIADYFNVTTDYLLGKEKTAILSDDGLNAEFTSLFSQLGAVEQNIVLSQIKGILLAKEL